MTNISKESLNHVLGNGVVSRRGTNSNNQVHNPYPLDNFSKNELSGCSTTPIIMNEIAKDRKTPNNLSNNLHLKNKDRQNNLSFSHQTADTAKGQTHYKQYQNDLSQDLPINSSRKGDLQLSGGVMACSNKMPARPYIQKQKQTKYNQNIRPVPFLMPVLSNKN